MCGIVGIINGDSGRGVNWAYSKLMEQAVRCNSLRGTDSTGVMQLDKKKLYVHKKAIPGWLFADDDKTDGFLRDADTATFTVVHNRAATAGKITDEQAHPFTLNNGEGGLLMGVHNGTLQGWDATNYGVDSEWALAQIAEKGDDAFSLLQGAYAFVWYDQRTPGTMFMARNAERPMFVAYVKDTPRAVFGSEPDMLAWLARRNSIVLEPDILELTPNRKYSFQLSDPRKFTSISVPTFRPVSSVMYDEGDWGSRYYGYRRQSVNQYWTKEGCVNGMLAILSKVPKTTTSTQLVPTGPAKMRVRMKPNVTAEEERVARLSEVLGSEGVFLGDVYDSETRTLWGEVEIDGDSAAAVMRGVSVGYHTYMQRQGAVIVTVIGAFQQPGIAGTKELAVVVLPKPGRGRNKDDTAAADAIADAVSEEIDNIRRNAALN